MLACLASCRMGPVDKIHICKMRLSSLYDSYDLWHLYIRRFLFGLSTLFWFLTSWMLDLIKTSRMSDFNMSDVRCRILTSRMSDFYKSYVGSRILTSRMSDFESRMSDGTYKLPYVFEKTRVSSYKFCEENKSIKLQMLALKK